MGVNEKLPWQSHGDLQQDEHSCAAKIQVTEDIREWDYGNYEGITSPEIRELRKKQGLDVHWDIWKDGCPGGE